MELPVSLGSDDTLTVWLNGEKIVAENVTAPARPIRRRPMLKLKAGKNQLLMKVCQGTGDWAFYFKASDGRAARVTWAFEDVSDAVGLGADGIGSKVKGDTPDRLRRQRRRPARLPLRRRHGHAGAEHAARASSKPRTRGISYKTGKVGPVFGDFDNDGLPDLFVPQNGRLQAVPQRRQAAISPT